MKTLLTPLKLITLIPNDDLNEVFMKSRITSFLVYAFALSFLSFVLAHFVGIVLPMAIIIALIVALLYVALRYSLATSEMGTLLSEEVGAKLQKVETAKHLEVEYASFKLQQESIIKGLVDKACNLEAHIYDLEATNKRILEKNKELVQEKEFLNQDIVGLNIQIAELKGVIRDFSTREVEGKKAAYEMAVEHTGKLNKIKKSIAQNPSDERRAELMADEKVIEDEKAALLGVEIKK